MINEVIEMKCSEFNGLLDDYLDGDITSKQRAAFESHFRECPTCGRLLEESLTILNRLRAEISPTTPRDAESFRHSKQSLEVSINAMPRKSAGRSEIFRWRGFVYALVAILLIALIGVSAYAKELHGILKEMKSEDPAVRSAVVAQLGSEILRPEVVEAITNAVFDEAPEVRAAVCNTVTEAIRDSMRAGFHVTDLFLSDEDPGVRMSAIDSLLTIGPWPEVIGPKLIKMLDDPDTEVRWKALMLLGAVAGYNPHQEYWRREIIYAITDATEDDDFDTRRQAVSALGHVGPDPDVIDLLIGLLDDAEIGSAAASSLGDIGRKTSGGLKTIIVNALIKALDDENVRLCATFALSRIRTGIEGAIPKLVRVALEGEDPDRGTAIRTLGDMGPDAADTLPMLIDALGDETLYIRKEAADAIAQIGATPDAIPPLMENLIHDDWGVRQQTALALGAAGHIAEDSLPILINALGDDQPQVREVVVDVIPEVGTWPGDVDLIIPLLKDEDKWVRAGAARVLGRIGPDAGSAVDALIGLLDDEEYRVSEAAAYALGKIGPEAKAAIPKLIEMLGSNDHITRSDAIEPLGMFGPDAREAVPMLIEMLGDEENYSPGFYTVRALGAIGPEPGVADALIKVMSHDNQNVRENAAESLGGMGGEPGVRDALLTALTEGEHGMKISAAKAIGNIGAWPEAVDALIDVLDTDSSFLTWHACIALGKAGRNGEPAIKELRRVLERQEKQQAMGILQTGRASASAHFALFMLGDEPDKHLAGLTEILGSTRYSTLEMTVELLGFIGPDARRALPALKELAATDTHRRGDEGFAIRRAARKAISEIEGI